jgi:hypothetical protein
VADNEQEASDRSPQGGCVGWARREHFFSFVVGVEWLFSFELVVFLQNGNITMQRGLEFPANETADGFDKQGVCPPQNFWQNR